MKNSDSPLMEVELHKWIHQRWPSPVYKKVGLNDPGYLSMCELLLREGRRPKNEKSYFWISVHYDFESFTPSVNGDCQAVFSINDKKLLCMLIEEDQEVSLKNTSEGTLRVLKMIAGTEDMIVIEVAPVEFLPMPRISNENGSRGAVIEDGYFRFVKE